MNKYPGWLNALVLIIFLTGLLLALPNIYGTTPAVQLSGMDGTDLSEARLEQVVQSIENAGITPEAAYLKDGRIVLRFDSVAEQRDAEEQRSDSVKRVFRYNLRDAGLLHLDLGIFADLHDNVVFTDSRDFAEHTAGRENFVAFLQRRNQLRMCFLFFLLGANQQKVERSKNDSHWQQKTECVALLGALRVCVLN